VTREPFFHFSNVAVGSVGGIFAKSKSVSSRVGSTFDGLKTATHASGRGFTCLKWNTRAVGGNFADAKTASAPVGRTFACLKINTDAIGRSFHCLEFITDGVGNGFAVPKSAFNRVK